MTDRYRIYGNLESRDAIALTSIMMAKDLSAELIEETPSLVLTLATRSGHRAGPYLRTADGFVLGDLHSISNWLERVHPDPALLPRTPVRRICARLLEDWIEFWLPLWPGGSWPAVGAVGVHLACAGCLLGASPTRPDWLLAAWIEAEIVRNPEARASLTKVAPALLGYGSELLEKTSLPVVDDAIPITLLSLLEVVSRDYHRYLALNRSALEDRNDWVRMELESGEHTFPVRPICENRRFETAKELEALEREDRLAVRRVLEPVGAWQVLTLRSVLEKMDPLDPRSL